MGASKVVLCIGALCLALIPLSGDEKKPSINADPHDALVAKLGHDEFDTRLAASEALEKSGCFAYPALIRGTYVHDFEVRYRVDALLKPYVEMQRLKAEQDIERCIKCTIVSRKFWPGGAADDRALDTYIDVSNSCNSLYSIESPVQITGAVNDDGTTGAAFPWGTSVIASKDGVLRNAIVTLETPGPKVRSVKVEAKMNIVYCFDPERFEVKTPKVQDLKIRDGIFTIDTYTRGADKTECVAFRVHQTLSELYLPSFRAWDSSGAPCALKTEWEKDVVGYKGTLTTQPLGDKIKLAKFEVTYFRHLAKGTFNSKVTIEVPVKK